MAVRFLKLLEQSGVLDGDDRLIGKHLDEFDLVVAVWASSASADLEHADALGFANERHGQRRQARVFAVVWILGDDGRVRTIRYMNRSAFTQRTARWSPLFQREGFSNLTAN